jgi:hypothetical protein
MMKNGALLVEGRPCFLDHLIPLCHLFDMPLITNNEYMLSLAESLYPPTKIIYRKNPVPTLDKLECVFYAQPYRLFPKGIQFPNFFYPREVRSCCTLHGNSEKYLDDFWLERLVDEDIVLIYGQLLVDLLKKKKVYSKLKTPLICGNVRYQFYKKHQLFFDKKVSTFLPSQGIKKRILWAPSWDPENKKGFFNAARQLLPQLPSEFQLVIKLHPLIEKSFPKEIEDLRRQYREDTDIFILGEMPLVYPLLAQADLFLGDISSVGYDFLTFNRPMYFLGKPGPLLHSLGTVVLPEDLATLFHTMSEEEPSKYREERARWYSYAFSEVSVEKVKEEFATCV